MTEPIPFNTKVQVPSSRPEAIDGLYRTKFKEQEWFLRITDPIPHTVHSVGLGRKQKGTNEEARGYIPCACPVTVEVKKDGGVKVDVDRSKDCPLCDLAATGTKKVWKAFVHWASYNMILGYRPLGSEDEPTQTSDLEIWVFNDPKRGDIKANIGARKTHKVTLRVSCTDHQFQKITITPSPYELEIPKPLLAKLTEHLEKKSLERYCEPPPAEEVKRRWDEICKGAKDGGGGGSDDEFVGGGSSPTPSGGGGGGASSMSEDDVNALLEKHNMA